MASSAATSPASTPASRSGAQVSRTAETSTPRTASTSSDGRYEFRDVAPGRYMLRVERSGYLALTYGQRRPGEHFYSPRSEIIGSTREARRAGSQLARKPQAPSAATAIVRISAS